jgi:hypothetical protein
MTRCERETKETDDGKCVHNEAPKFPGHELSISLFFEELGDCAKKTVGLKKIGQSGD